MEFEMPDQGHSLVEHFVTLIAFEIKLFVVVHVVLKPVPVRKGLATQVTENVVL